MAEGFLGKVYIVGAGLGDPEMGLANLKENMSRLMAGGCEAERPVALVRWGTRPYQQTLIATLGTIVDLAEQRKFRPPAVIIVGDVVRFGNRFHFSASPLAKAHFPAHQ